MSVNVKQESNATGLSIAKESALGVLTSPIWLPREPNTYKDFGGQYKLVARQPINASRQSRKGVTTDLDASGGWQEDLTYDNTQSIIEGVLFAAFRKKAELAIATVTTSQYSPVAGGTGYAVGDLLLAKGFTAAGNNGLAKVNGSPATAAVPVTKTLIAATGEAGTISKVGVEFGSGDLTYDVTSGVTSLLSTTKDFTTIASFVPGEWIYIGDDGAGTVFATADNNGFARIFSVTAHKIILDSVEGANPATDAGTGQTVRIFFGRYIRNEADPSLIVRTTYNLERTLGKLDTTDPYFQAEYLNGSVIDTFTVTFNSADKITYEVDCISQNYEVRDSATQGQKAGTRAAAKSGSAYNTSTQMKMINLHVAGTATPLYAYLTDASIKIDNNCKPNKALGVLGAFDITAGQLSVTATATAYFQSVAAAESIKDNLSCQFSIAVANSNSGIVFDLPLVTLGDGRNKVAANEPITLGLTVDAASASVLSATTDYTVSVTYFDYLPTAVAP